ncbi:alpha/beta fold hydrolase [Streptomyces sp. NPDC005336]|uniref:thioesterase II family protein n=1 Tax=Streptomyces sp. NPDC005336 TaxID=3157035 RepID=UPI0033B8154D
MTAQTTELVPETPYIWRAKKAAPTHRLICFPHAGAGATAYADWAPLLPPQIEIVAVQLPGRQSRIAEEPFAQVAPLVQALSHALRPVLDLPFAFFGHSCGAALAHELAKALRAQKRPGPQTLFLSAQPAPGAQGVRPLHRLPEDEFSQAILELGGIDPEIAADPYVMATLLPVLRADFALWETHHPAPEAPLDCPIVALAGDSDPRTSRASVDMWRDHTDADFRSHFYPGGHFYFLDRPADVVSLIGRILTTASTSGGTA